MKIKPGDKLPESDFFYLDDANEVKKISTSDLFKSKKVIILGMPGAFTKTCSATHLPGYVKNFDLALKKGITKIICIAVNAPVKNMLFSHRKLSSSVNKRKKKKFRYNKEKGTKGK